MAKIILQRNQNIKKKQEREQKERERVCELVTERIQFPGIEHYLPFFSDQMVTHEEYFLKTGGSQILFNPKKAWDRIQVLKKECKRAFKEASGENHPMSSIVPGDRFFFPNDYK